jgi:hypothetical protein
MPLFFLLIPCDLSDLKKVDVGLWCLINGPWKGAVPTLPHRGSG